MQDRWQEDKIQLVYNLAGQGYSASEIAVHLGVTRNAVIGLCHRRHIKLLRGTKPSKDLPRLAVEAYRPQKTIFHPPKFKTDSLGLLGNDALWAGKGIRVVDAEPTSCRWPQGTSKDGSPMCCGALISHGSYCASHHTVSLSGKQPELNVNYIVWKNK